MENCTKCGTEVAPTAKSCGKFSISLLIMDPFPPDRHQCDS